MKDNIVYYGGTFDPIHNGHYEVIKFLNKNYKKVIVIPSLNYNKDNSKYSLELRFQALKELCSNLNNVIISELAFNEDTRSTYNVSKKIEEIYGEKPIIAFGSDCLLTMENWINYEKLKNDYEFLIFKRDNIWKELPIMYEEANIKIEFISSSQIKQANEYYKIPKKIRYLFL